MRRAGTARDDGDSRPAGELSVGVGHVRGAGLVAAGDQPDRRIVKTVEHSEEALARHAEHRVGAVHDELVDEELPAVPAHMERSGEYDVGTRIRFCWVWISGWILPRNVLKASSACSFARGSLPSAYL